MAVCGRRFSVVWHRSSFDRLRMRGGSWLALPHAEFVEGWKQALCLAGLALALMAPRAQAARVVSTSLCGDAYVWALASAQDIAALSWQADTRLSAAPPPLRLRNRGRNDAERLLALAPSLVVLGPGDAPRATRLLQKTGAAVFALAWSEGFDGVTTNLLGLGKAMGREAAARAAIARINARLAAMRKEARSLRSHPRVLYLAPGGMSAGSGTFVDAAIAAAGGRNHAASLGLSGWGRAPLEKLALDPPDLIITSFFGEGYASVTDLRSRHPLLQHLLKSTPVAAIPARDWVCASPLLADAAAAIQAALRALPDEPGA